MSERVETPMIRQYQRIRASCPGALLFFRLGDFYEMFFEDAETGARELEITLTSRTTGAGGRVPMCGIPHHAADSYIARLVEKGYKVAVCDQVEDPRQARGLVKREVVRIVTPGTLLDPGVLPEKGNNYIASVAHDRASGALGLASLDYSTGEFQTGELTGEGALQRLADELSCLEPAEVVVQPSVAEAPEAGGRLERILGHPPHTFSERSYHPAEAARVLLDHFGTGSLEPFGCSEQPAAAAAAGGLLAYLRETRVGALSHIRVLRTVTGGRVMSLDTVTRRNLELVEPLRAGTGPTRTLWVRRGLRRAGTLLGVLDHTVTSAGGRLLRAWVLHPLTLKEDILSRQEAVMELVAGNLAREELRSTLRRTYDLERLVARAATGSAGPRDLVALKDSLDMAPLVVATLDLMSSQLLSHLSSRLDGVEEFCRRAGRALTSDPPAGSKDGGLIRAGYSEEVDALRSAAGEGKEWVARMETSERTRTGIKSLKIGYSRVFGYFIEITRPNLDAVPEEYLRRQTLANAERFVTPELKEREAAILGAEERLKEVEHDLFCALRDEAVRAAERIQGTARALATLDALLSLAEAARRFGYRRPDISEEPGLVITSGRHPVVERLDTDEEFVPNDCHLGGTAPSFAIITGPNMAGKSTYCRQVALITLMAQMGSLVPAEAARIGLVDRVFTRIGASDELSSGRSTFLVEMGETANILNHATRRSLILLDEIGRGTSTYDGLSLAWAVVEHITGHIGALTLFATHYHELTELPDLIPGVANYAIAVRETGDDIIFLRKVARGAVDRSYGIQVARLAGLPQTVINRAREILHGLESAVARKEIAAVGESDGRPGRPSQMVLFENPHSLVENEIAGLDLMNLTPLEALTKLHELQERVRRGRG